MPAPHPPAGTADRRPSARRRTDDCPAPVWAVVVSAAAILAYGNTFSVPFLFDDVSAIANNPSIRHLATALWPPLNTSASGRPVLNLSFAINYAISGEAVWSYHLANLAIHICAGLALFGIARRTPHCGNPAAFGIALLWTLHPLQTESVTYIVQRAESLMGLFYLLTLYCFVRHAERRPGVGSFWARLSVLACLLGMATKEVMVSAPLIVLLYDRTFLAGSFREALRLRGKVYAGLFATWLALPVLVLSSHSRAGSSEGVAWWSYALTQFPAIARYLKLSVWPHPLVFDYGTQWVGNVWTVLPSAALVIALFASAAWALLGPARAFGFAGAWFFAILAPTSLVPGNRQTAAEHRMYLALVPIVAIAAIGIHRRMGRAAPAIYLALAAVLGAVTYRRNEIYASAPALWTDAVARCPDNAFAHYGLGDAWSATTGRLDDAIAEYQEAIRLKPDYAVAHNSLGIALSKVPGRMNEAAAQFQEAIRLNPNYAKAHDNLGAVWSITPGRMGEAVAELEIALRLAPEDAVAHNNLGSALSKIPGRMNDAIAQFQEAVRLNPNYAKARENLAKARASQP